MSIRDITHLSPDYYEINREERNYAAILFAALCQPGNVERFLRFLGHGSHVGPEFGIYLEYAYLRDLWSRITEEEQRRAVIQGLLPIRDIEALVRLPIEQFNRTFGAAGRPSTRFIQSPGMWSVVKFDENFRDNDDFLKICRFKWSFNIKPDIVIHLDRNRAICVEAKFKSAEGSYPSSADEKAIFSERGLDRVGQTALQQYMMEDLLGVRSDFVLLVARAVASQTHRMITWKDAFGCIDMTGMPHFAAEMAARISGAS